MTHRQRSPESAVNAMLSIFLPWAEAGGLSLSPEGFATGLGLETREGDSESAFCASKRCLIYPAGLSARDRERHIARGLGEVALWLEGRREPSRSPTTHVFLERFERELLRRLGRADMSPRRTESNIEQPALPV